MICCPAAIIASSDGKAEHVYKKNNLEEIAEYLPVTFTGVIVSLNSSLDCSMGGSKVLYI